MPIYVALLRGVNVGGKNRLAMASLREAVASLGCTNVRTYVQSGNVVFAGPRRSSARVAGDVRGAIAARTGLDVEVVVRTGAEMAAVVKANPFRTEARDPAKVHVVFRNGPGTWKPLAGLDLAGYAPENAKLVRGHLYLSLPDGMGRSRLAADLARRGGATATARNWRTVTALLEMAANG